LQQAYSVRLIPAERNMLYPSGGTVKRLLRRRFSMRFMPSE
jgi:hypothetical protein